MSVALLAILGRRRLRPRRPRLPAERVRYMIDHAQLRWLHQQHLRDALPRPTHT